jgi:hypothetical protein
MPAVFIALLKSSDISTALTLVIENALTEQAVTAAMTAAKILVRKLCFFVLVVVIVISPSLFSAAFDIRVISDTLDFFFIMISPSDDLLVWVVNIFFMMNLLSVSVLFLLFLVYLTDVDSLFTDTRDFKKFFRKNKNPPVYFSTTGRHKKHSPAQGEAVKQSINHSGHRFSDILRNRHTADGKVFVQYIKACRIASSSAAPTFICFEKCVVPFKMSTLFIRSSSV